MLDSEEPNVEVFAELSAGQRDGCGAPGGKVQAIKYLNSRSGLGSSCIPCKCCQCGCCKDRNSGSMNRSQILSATRFSDSRKRPRLLLLRTCRRVPEGENEPSFGGG